MAPSLPLDDSDIERQIARALTESRFPGLVSAYLFGSVAEGRAHRDSDVDLGVYLDFESLPTSEARFDARLDLMAVLGPAIGRDDIDLVVMNDAPPTLSRHILRGKRVFCADVEADHAFVRTVLIRAADLDPFLRKMRRVALDTLAR